MRLIERSAWGARAPKSPGLTVWAAGEPSSSTAHYDAGTDPDLNGSDDYFAARVRGIQRFHQAGEYVDLAYNYLVAPTGTVFVGRGRLYRSAANGTTFANRTSLAVCYLGNERTPLTYAARVAFDQLARSVPGLMVPHNQWKATGCPGPALEDWLASGRPIWSPTVPLPAPTERDVEVFGMKSRLLQGPVQLDANGNGFGDFPMAADELIVSSEANAADPATHGYGFPETAALRVNHVCRVVVRGGPPRGRVDVRALVARPS